MLFSGCGKSNVPSEADCSQILDKKLRSECMYNRSVLSKNPAYCKEVPDVQMREDCINEIAIMLGSDMHCMQHERLSARDNCERVVAEALKKKKLEAEKNKTNP